MLETDNKCKFCDIPIYINVNGDYLELPNNICPMCGEKVEFGLKERTDKEINS